MNTKTFRCAIFDTKSKRFLGRNDDNRATHNQHSQQKVQRQSLLSSISINERETALNVAKEMSNLQRVYTTSGRHSADVNATKFVWQRLRMEANAKQRSHVSASLLIRMQPARSISLSSHMFNNKYHFITFDERRNVILFKTANSRLLQQIYFV